MSIWRNVRDMEPMDWVIIALIYFAGLLCSTALTVMVFVPLARWLLG